MAYDAQCRLGSRLNAFRLDSYIELKAWLDARSNIGRSGASRSDYYEKLNVVVDIGGVDFSGLIRHGTLRISEALNDEPDTASFTLVPSIPSIPHVGDIVRIGLGTVENLEFGGRIVSIQHTREAARNPPFLQILCTDFLPDFDQRLVNMAWPRQSATATILSLVAGFCQHNPDVQFGTSAVKPDLPTLEAFEVINAQPSDVMRRLMTLCSGGFYIDATCNLHAWAGGSEPGYPDPTPLALDVMTLKSFAHVEDGAQARTAMVVEGPSTTLLMPMPASSIPYTSTVANQLDYGIPIADATMFVGQSNFEARIGSQRVIAGGAFRVSTAYARDSELTVDVAVSGGWHAVTYADGGAFLGDLAIGGLVWVQVGEQYCLHHRGGDSTLYLFAVPASYAGLQFPVKAGTTVTKVDALWVLTGQTSIATQGSGPQPIRAQPSGADVVGVVRVSRNPALGVWPPANVEHLISDNRLSFAGAVERANIELDNFAHVDLTCQWDTDDPNARIGRHQAIALGTPDALTTTVVILTSEITFPVTNHAPMRSCSGGAVKRANILDIMLTAKD